MQISDRVLVTGKERYMRWSGVHCNDYKYRAKSTNPLTYIADIETSKLYFVNLINSTTIYKLCSQNTLRKNNKQLYYITCTT
jgi:hypothetical protein